MTALVDIVAQQLAAGLQQEAVTTGTAAPQQVLHEERQRRMPQVL